MDRPSEETLRRQSWSTLLRVAVAALLFFVNFIVFGLAQALFPGATWLLAVFLGLHAALFLYVGISIGSTIYYRVVDKKGSMTAPLASADPTFRRFIVREYI